MPKSDLHKSKKKKNLALLAVIAAWVALIWVVTMIKVNHGG
jgi:hypothetical protein